MSPIAFSICEVAKLLGIGKNTTYALVRSKKLRSIRVGRQYRIPKSALDEYLAGLEPDHNLSA